MAEPPAKRARGDDGSLDVIATLLKRMEQKDEKIQSYESILRSSERIQNAKKEELLHKRISELERNATQAPNSTTPDPSAHARWSDVKDQQIIWLKEENIRKGVYIDIYEKEIRNLKDANDVKNTTIKHTEELLEKSKMEYTQRETAMLNKIRELERQQPAALIAENKRLKAELANAKAPQRPSPSEVAFRTQVKGLLDARDNYAAAVKKDDKTAAVKLSDTAVVDDKA